MRETSAPHHQPYISSAMDQRRKQQRGHPRFSGNCTKDCAPFHPVNPSQGSQHAYGSLLDSRLISRSEPSSRVTSLGTSAIPGTLTIPSTLAISETQANPSTTEPVRRASADSDY